MNGTQENVASIYHQLAVKSSKTGDVRVNVINQANLKGVFWKKNKDFFLYWIGESDDIMSWYYSLI